MLANEAPATTGRGNVMDFELPKEDDPRRVEVRAWFAARPRPTGRQLAEAGYATLGGDAPPGEAAPAEASDAAATESGSEAPKSDTADEEEAKPEESTPTPADVVEET